MSESENEAKVMNPSDAAEFLEKAGIRPSPVRMLIMRCLAEEDGPVSAMEIETALETVDRSSISRALALFQEKGLLHAIDDGSGSVKYELCTAPFCDGCRQFHSDLHAHFHCLHCGRTFCLTDVKIESPALPPGFRAVNANYVVSGFCRECLAKTEIMP